MPYDFEIVYEIIGESSYVYDLEQILKNCNNKNKYIPLQEFGGRYECFKELDMSCFEDYNLGINS